MALAQVDPQQYEVQLHNKVMALNELLLPFHAPAPDIFPSPATHYRMRAEFKFWHDHENSYFAMTGDNGETVRVDSFPVACERINTLMTVLRAALQSEPMLRRKLFQVEFLATTTGDAIISLIYHKPLDDIWQQRASVLQQKLGCSIIGRSRGKKIVLGKDHVIENFSIAGELFSQQQPESAFSQPNAAVNQHMLEWAVSCCRGPGGDLLELYCGNGNFTLPLSRHFEKVLATEVSKTSVNALQNNVLANQCDNISLARLSSEEFTEALNAVRPFRRLAHINLQDYHFSTVLVDPPRAGLDDGTLRLLERFENILYISCNPTTLAQNLQTLCQTHTIQRTALFDQFPYTHHMEAGVFLAKKGKRTP
ncbi:MAG TPA: tRNA (uridine(54)-C5)-methyltransferase TrmA [Pseudomonadales bacterium]|nr:tRNA (uridine(54)-C5)-methyltransferase TrmA [Pseudomonadales bacterium]